MACGARKNLINMIFVFEHIKNTLKALLRLQLSFQSLDLIVLIRMVAELRLEMPWSPSYEPSKFGDVKTSKILFLTIHDFSMNVCIDEKDEERARARLSRDGRGRTLNLPP